MALRLESLWLQMRDGARIAIDLVLPTAVPAEASLGSVLIPAREWLSVDGGGPLAPTSVRIETGWRLRLALAGADRGTFGVAPGQPKSITLEYGGPASSRLLLPT